MLSRGNRFDLVGREEEGEEEGGEEGREGGEGGGEEGGEEREEREGGGGRELDSYSPTNSS